LGFLKICDCVKFVRCLQLSTSPSSRRQTANLRVVRILEVSSLWHLRPATTRCHGHKKSSFRTRARTKILCVVWMSLEKPQPRGMGRLEGYLADGRIDAGHLWRDRRRRRRRRGRLRGRPSPDTPVGFDARCDASKRWTDSSQAV